MTTTGSVPNAVNSSARPDPRRKRREPADPLCTRRGVVVGAETLARWHAWAACAEVVCDDEWFPSPRATVNPMVLRLCGACPVWRNCLVDALAHPEIWHGIWAGLTARELAVLRCALLAGQPATNVIDRARHLAMHRRTVPVYKTGVPHPLPSRRQLRRQRQQLAGLLPTPDRPEPDTESGSRR